MNIKNSDVISLHNRITAVPVDAIESRLNEKSSFTFGNDTPVTCFVINGNS